MTRYWTAAIVAVAMLSFGGLRAQDREATFIATAGESGKAEVALAELAQQKAQDPRVRNYAVRLRTDHTSANRELGARLPPIAGSPSPSPEQRSRR